MSTIKMAPGPDPQANRVESLGFWPGDARGRRDRRDPLLLFPPGGGGLVERFFAPKPNILLILADDMGWNDVGFHLGDVESPNLDRLAKDGADLEALYVLPLYADARRADDRALPVPLRAAAWRHPPRVRLRAAAHRAAPVGAAEGGRLRDVPDRKWHLGHHAPEYLPMARGFDYHYGNYCAGVDYFTKAFMGVPDWHRGNSPSSRKAT